MILLSKPNRAHWHSTKLVGSLGTDTRIISKDSSSGSGVDGSTTICSNRRIISVGKDPEKNT